MRLNGLLFSIFALAVLGSANDALSQTPEQRQRARSAGVIIGIIPPGRLNAITDVAGVRVGQTTIQRGDNVRTGVTAILPHSGNLFRERVPAAIYVANAFVKLVGATQVRELGELETPILLTCTLCVWKVADAMVDHLLQKPDMREVRSINPVVGETNDGSLNDVRSRPITKDDVVNAIENASTGPVAEGAVGAGTGTVAFGWKGGIGTSSRVLPKSLGGYTVGVLVQSNYGGVLSINGAPVGRELNTYQYSKDLSAQISSSREDRADGSIMMVVATDAPLMARNLERIAARAIVGLSRTGSSMSNGSGDYVIAFSTAVEARRPSVNRLGAFQELSNDAISPLFLAVAEATEEAIINSIFMATTVTGSDRTIEALPIDKTLTILRKYNALGWDRTLPPAR